jgi:hypothetical protein
MPNDLPDSVTLAQLDAAYAEGCEDDAPPDPLEVARGILAVLPDVALAIPHCEGPGTVIQPAQYGGAALRVPGATVSLVIALGGATYVVAVQRRL